MWEVIFDADFEAEFQAFADAVGRAILAKVDLLRDEGPNLGRPNVDTVKGSAFNKYERTADPMRRATLANPVRLRPFSEGRLAGGGR